MTVLKLRYYSTLPYVGEISIYAESPLLMRSFKSVRPVLTRCLLTKKLVGSMSEVIRPMAKMVVRILTISASIPYRAGAMAAPASFVVLNIIISL